MTRLEVEIEYIAGHGPNFYRTVVYEVHFGNEKEPTRMAKEIFRSPTMKIAVQTLAGIVASE